MRKREIIRHKMSGILMDTDEWCPMECKVTIGDKDGMGICSLELPLVTSVFQQPSEGIWFNIDGAEEPMEFDDLDIDDLEKILDELLNL